MHGPEVVHALIPLEHTRQHTQQNQHVALCMCSTSAGVLQVNTDLAGPAPFKLTRSRPGTVHLQHPEHDCYAHFLTEPSQCLHVLVVQVYCRSTQT